MAVLIVGSIALDDVKTPVEERFDLLGGSASYASVAAGYFSPVNLVAIVGEDFPADHWNFLQKRGINLEGVQRAPGKTFRWSGEYMWDMNTRETRSVALNVFETFSPTLPDHFKSSDFVLLANIAPDLQLQVLDQMEKPKFVIADTMDLWINIAQPALLDLLKRVDMLILNDSEARELTKETSLIKAGKKIQSLGPRIVAVKKGEHGCLLFGENGDFFSCPAYPLEDIHDPTGAGDTFAGGLTGYLASRGNHDVSFKTLKTAVVVGSVLASYNVEAFSLERMRSVEQKDILSRFAQFQDLAHFEADLP
ncbi:MAG: PfkB family carbohydrate kinase [Chthoniobacterales bacterium]|jgi:sugar/nucleoside kinase (ribokinase family)